MTIFKYLIRQIYKTNTIKDYGIPQIEKKSTMELKSLYKKYIKYMKVLYMHDLKIKRKIVHAYNFKFKFILDLKTE